MKIYVHRLAALKKNPISFSNSIYKNYLFMGNLMLKNIINREWDDTYMPKFMTTKYICVIRKGVNDYRRKKKKVAQFIRLLFKNTFDKCVGAPHHHLSRENTTIFCYDFCVRRPVNVSQYFFSSDCVYWLYILTTLCNE